MAQECTNAIECCDPSTFTYIPNSGKPIPPAVPVTCNAMNDFGVWLDGAPVLCSAGDQDFGIWVDGSPFVEKSNTY